MFVYNFKESKLPDINTLKANIETELFMITSQKKHATNSEELVYRDFIDMSVYTYLNFNNAFILTEFSNAFSLIANILNNLNIIEENLLPIKELIDTYNFDKDFNQQKFLEELQIKLENYYNIKNKFFKQTVEDDDRLNTLIFSLNSFAIKKSSIPAPESYTDDINLETLNIPSQLDTLSEDQSKININTTDDIEKEILAKDSIPKIDENIDIDKIVTINIVSPKEKMIKITGDSPSNHGVVKIVTDNKDDKSGKDINNQIHSKEKPSKSKKTEKKSIVNIHNIKNVDSINNSISDNRLLLISEKDNKVYLPYYYSDLKGELSRSSYKDINELISKKYILSLDEFKNPLISRFKQGFNLMRKKECASIKDSISFGFELMSNYQLHPAVIAACRNLDELDSFLDTIDQNSFNTFDLFDIKFEVTPAIKRF